MINDQFQARHYRQAERLKLPPRELNAFGLGILNAFGLGILNVVRDEQRLDRDSAVKKANRAEIMLPNP